MNRQEPPKTSWPRLAIGIARGSLVGLYDHWTVALFSLVAAFAIWFVIQDVENPRIQADFPADGTSAIPVVAKNAGEFIPTGNFSVALRIEGRESDVAKLSLDDFEASVDIKGVVPGAPESLPVKVTAPSGIKVLSVSPSTVLVSVAPVVEQQFDVVVDRVGQLPTGFVEDDIKIEPPQVTVRGLQDDLARIASVNVSINLSNRTEGSFVIENDLTARSVTGGQLDLSITPARAKVTLDVKQEFVQRSLPVVPILSGQPAAGYRIAGISVEPSSIAVSGPAATLAALSQLATEPVQLTNATGEIRLLKSIDVPQNVSVERRSVTVIIQVKSIDCVSGATGSACGTFTIQVAPTFENQPPGLILVGTARVTVQLTGPLAVLDSITPGQITAKVSLSAATPGTANYAVTVSVPSNLSSQGVRAEQPAPIPLTLAPQ